MSEVSKFFGLGFSALLPLVNPIGSALMFMSIVGSAPPEVYRVLARKIAIATTLFLVGVQLVGAVLLRFFGISLPVMQVSGGLVLAAMGMTLLNENDSDLKREADAFNNAELGLLQQKVFYPLTFPITAGTGCIVVMVTLSAHASSKGLVLGIVSHLGLVLAVVLVSVGVYFCYAYAPKIAARISPHTVRGVLRVVAFVLLCIGVQITWNGIEAMLKSVLKG